MLTETRAYGTRKTEKRNSFETMQMILRQCASGSKKTHIMYRANLSHEQLEKFLAILFDKEFLAIKGGNYTTTQRGYLFIKKFEELVNFINAEDIPYRDGAPYLEQHSVRAR
jgi:predicted transcriptional regulator